MNVHLIGASAGNRKPPDRRRPSSRREQSIPKDSIFEVLPPLMSNPESLAPTSAQGTFMPAATLGAPQTICRRFALPCIYLADPEFTHPVCITDTTSGDLDENGATGETSSTPPAMVRASAICFGGQRIGDQLFESEHHRPSSCVWSGELAQKRRSLPEKQAYRSRRTNMVAELIQPMPNAPGILGRSCRCATLVDVSTLPRRFSHF